MSEISLFKNHTNTNIKIFYISIGMKLECNQSHLKAKGIYQREKLFTLEFKLN